MIVDGISLGRVKHLYSGTEYYIEELCIKTEMQGIGIGSKFIEMIEKYLVKHNIHRIFLQTEDSGSLQGSFPKSHRQSYVGQWRLHRNQLLRSGWVMYGKSGKPYRYRVRETLHLHSDPDCISDPAFSPGP